MQGFMLDENGDLLIQNNSVQMVESNDLICQTVKTVLSINQGEWFFNTSLGIDFSALLGKHAIDKAYCRHIIQQALSQVDNSLTITDFTCEHDKINRKLTINFKAINEEGETVEVTNTWA